MRRTRSALSFCPRLRASALGRLCLLAVSLTLAEPTAAVTIQFDYRHDTAGFFGTAASPTPARTALEFAGRTFSGFTDSLAPIQPGGSNNWIAQFQPVDGPPGIANLAVPADVVLVFAGANDLANAKLGEAGPGFFTLPSGSNPSPNFMEAITNRAQGSSAEEFAPWGGFIEFDTHNAGEPRNWHFNLDAPPAAAAYDFYTVAVHELAHLFGFGASTAFSANVVDGKFNGENVVDVYGQSAPLQNNQHWAAAVTSPPYMPGAQPRPSLGPTLPAGVRRLFTPLDYAAMADIGWEVSPALLELHGDADFDHDVDGDDFLLWQRNLGGFGGSQGDVNGDLVVDAYDGWITRNNFGAKGMAPSTLAHTSASVPEPSAALLAAVSGLALLLREARRNHR